MLRARVCIVRMEHVINYYRNRKTLEQGFKILQIDAYVVNKALSELPKFTMTIKNFLLGCFYTQFKYNIYREIFNHIL